MSPKLFSFFILLIICFSCGKEDTAGEYIQKVNSSKKLVQHHKSRRIHIQCRYLPATYLALQAMNVGQADQPLGGDALKQEIKNYTQGYYFKLSLYTAGKHARSGPDLKKQASRISRLLQSHLSLHSDENHYKPLSAELSPLRLSKGFAAFTIVFPRDAEAGQSLFLQLNEKPFKYLHDTIRFEYDVETLRQFSFNKNL